MPEDVNDGACGGAVGLRLDSTTPNGKVWSCADLPSGTRRLADAEHHLSLGDLIAVHDAKTDARLGMLRVIAREGDIVTLERVRRGD